MVENLATVWSEMQRFRQDNPYLGNKSPQVLAYRARMGLPNGVTYVPARLKDCAPSKIDERLFYGMSTYIECSPFFQVRLRLLGKNRSLGTCSIMHNAAKLFDSGLFWLWGYCDRPSAKKFNVFRPEMAAPELLPSIKEIRAKLFRESGVECLDFHATQTLHNQPS